ncbi:MAG TPA: hypothetical protein VFO73_14280 [Candidatus Limnocylindrales bacterium]|nr:hypothetical protein [Candidatus Limnocylindrales bacterium]
MKRLVAAAASLLVVFLFLAPVALAADPSMPHTGRVLVSTGGDFTLPAGDEADAVVVVNGTATIEGRVNTVVIVDGVLNLNGATAETVVAIRSPLNLGADSVVLGDVMKLDSLVTKTGNAAINGGIRDIGSDLAGIGFVLIPVFFLLYIGFAIAAIVGGLVLAALAARQVRAAEGLISHEPGQVLVAAVIGIFLPIVVIGGLFVTVVGAPLAVALLIGVWPVLGLLGWLVAGIWIGDFILDRTSSRGFRERPYLAAVVGLVVLQVLAVFPPVSMIASFFGYGAVILLAWRVFRHEGSGEVVVPRNVAAPMPS